MTFQNVKIRVSKVNEREAEEVEIRCCEVNDCVREIVSFVKSRQGRLSGTLDGGQYEVPLTDILYIESVDSRTFLYTAKKTYESKQKLYELEDILKPRSFLRISKSSIINLMKITHIKPSLNSRFIAVLTSGEEIVISRKYVPDLKKTLKGEL